MKRLLISLIFLVGIHGYSQPYVEIGVDPNKLFGIMDNPRTEEDNRGFDFDVELGSNFDGFGVFLFYGRFEAADYQNYGAGADYRLFGGQKFQISLGTALSVVMKRQSFRENQGAVAWNSFFGWDARLKGIYWISSGVGLTGTFQYQRRTDLNIHGILEGKIGARIKLSFSEK